MRWWPISRRNVPSLRASGSRECAPDDAKQSKAPGSDWIASSQGLLAMTAFLSAETFRRAGNRPAAARFHPHDRKAAFVGAVGAETEQAVDAGKAGWVGQHFRRKPLAALRSRQCRDQCDRVIRQCRGAHRLGAVLRAVAACETAEAG